MREMISLQCKKILVVGGRLLDPRDSYNNENKELVNSLTIGKWQIEADLDKRVIRIKGPNRAIYPLMEGAIFLCKDKNENNVEVYFTKFYDTKILEFLKKYGIDDVIVEDPNHSFDFRGNTIVCTDGKISSETVFGENIVNVKNASYVLEYVKDDDETSQISNFKKSGSTFLKNKPEGVQCFLHTQDGVITLGDIFERKTRV